MRHERCSNNSVVKTYSYGLFSKVFLTRLRMRKRSISIFMLSNRMRTRESGELIQRTGISSIRNPIPWAKSSTSTYAGKSVNRLAFVDGSGSVLAESLEAALSVVHRAEPKQAHEGVEHFTERFPEQRLPAFDLAFRMLAIANQDIDRRVLIEAIDKQSDMVDWHIHIGIHYKDYSACRAPDPGSHHIPFPALIRALNDLNLGLTRGRLPGALESSDSQLWPKHV